MQGIPFFIALLFQFKTP